MIPLNNSLSKVESFIPSTRQDFNKTQRVKISPNYIETIPILSSLQEKGWEIKYGRELRNKSSKKPSCHRFQLQHPDLKMGEINSKTFKTQSFAQINIVNSCNGDSPLQLILGAYRQICSNGLMGFGEKFSQKIKHNENGINQIQMSLGKINDHAQSMINVFKSFQNIKLTPSQLNELTEEAMKIRFGNYNSDATQLNHIRRNEDTGMELWSVFNRVQENLTNANLIVNENGRLVNVGKIKSTNEEILVNTKLTELALSYV